MVNCAAMEHRHGCVYCSVEWFCNEDCPVPGLSACAACRENISRSPDTPRRVIPLSAGSPVLDRLAEQEAERLRRLIGRDPQP
jgi:hypothetical protein